MMPSHAFAQEWNQEHKPFLWGLAYRMTGNAADAEDIVQETFLRAIERPPIHTEAPWRPWLSKVALNLSRDFLRKRKQTQYKGPWLPTPVQTIPNMQYTTTEDNPETRYSMRESATLAFLLALEVLSPQQRAVLLLRDVAGYSTQQTSELLSISKSNTKTTLHRARVQMAPYEQNPCIPTQELQEKTQKLLEQFLGAFFHEDPRELEKLLAEEVTTHNDSNGKYQAAGRIVTGRRRVAKLYHGITQKSSAPHAFDFCLLNGLPAWIAERPATNPRHAPYFALAIAPNQQGEIAAIYNILADEKLHCIDFFSQKASLAPPQPPS